MTRRAKAPTATAAPPHFWLHDSESRTYARFRIADDRAELVRVQGWRPDFEIEDYRDRFDLAVSQGFSKSKAQQLAEWSARGWMTGQTIERNAAERGWPGPSADDLARIQLCADAFLAGERERASE